MNTKKICPVLLALSLLGASCSSVDGDEVNSQTGLPNAIYFEGTESSPISVVTVGDQGGRADVSLRSANLVSADVNVHLRVDASALEVYNAKHGTAYKVLPREHYELSASEVTISPSSVASRSVEVSFKPSVTELDPSIKYALPLTIEPASSGSAVLTSSATKILRLDRAFRTSVLRQKGFYLYMKFDEPVQLKEWTMVYGMRVDGLFDNQSVLSPSVYSRITGDGKLQFKAGETDDPKGFLKQKLVPNKWYHIAFVYKDKHVKAYLNGVLDTEFDVPTVESFTKFNFSWGNFVGYVRDIRLYNKALPASLIQENLYLEDPSNPNLVVYYPLTKETGLKNVKEDKNHFEAYISGGTPYTLPISYRGDVKFPQDN